MQLHILFMRHRELARLRECLRIFAGAEIGTDQVELRLDSLWVHSLEMSNGRKRRASGHKQKAEVIIRIAICGGRLQNDIKLLLRQIEFLLRYIQISKIVMSCCRSGIG